MILPSGPTGIETVQNSVRVGSLTEKAWVSMDSTGTAGQPFFEVQQGGNLQSAWQPLGKTTSGKPRLAPSQKLSVFRQLCSAMTHAHRHGVAHGKLERSFIAAVEAAATAASKPQEDSQPGSETEKDSRRDEDLEEEQAAPPAPTVKAFGFGFREGPDREPWRNAVKADTKMLGRLAVLLQGGCDMPDPYPAHDDEWWMDVAKDSHIPIRPVLVQLLKGKFTVENAMLDDLASNSLTEGPADPQTCGQSSTAASSDILEAPPPRREAGRSHKGGASKSICDPNCCRQQTSQNPETKHIPVYDFSSTGNDYDKSPPRREPGAARHRHHCDRCR